MTEPRPFVEPGFLAPGARVGHYSIIAKLGEGGEAVVYRARDLILERDVALKTPRCAFASAGDCARLLTEARAASRLSHPAIVAIHEVFEDNGKPWFAMDMVEGATLRAVLAQRGALPSEDVARYGEMLADALHAAHSKHILHRDVTPGNIFITPDGRLMLSDFGLARLYMPPEDPGSDAATTAVSATRVAGTFGYMSPEQMLGRDIGPQSDIFSAGTVLYQMASGIRAFGGATFGEVLDATLNREPPPLSRYGPVAPELERIVRKALAKRVDERYASAGELLVDLRALRRKLESGSHDAEPAPRPKPRRRRVLAGLVGLVAVAAIAGWAWLALRPRGLPQATPRHVTSASGWEAEARISPDGSDIVYTAEGADGNIDIWLVDAKGGTPIRLTDHPAADRSPTWFPEGSAIAFVSERNGTPDVWKVARLGGQPPTFLVANAQSPAVSPDGQRLAFTRPGESGDQRVFVARLADPARAQVLTTDRDGLWEHESPTWSPDGRTICYAAQRDLWTVDANGGRATRLTREGEADFEPAWPDSGWIYFTSLRGGTTAIWRVPDSGGSPERVTMGSGPERQPSLSRDGTLLTYSTFSINANVVIRILSTGSEFDIGGERSESSPALAPDASAVVYSSEQLKAPPDLWVQPLARAGAPAGPARRLTDLPGSSTHPGYSPDGRWVVFYRVLGDQRDIWIVPAAGGPAIRFTDDPAADYHPDWAPDGRQIAFVSERDGRGHIWVAPVKNGSPDGPARRLTSGPFGQLAPAWSPDSSLIAFIAPGEGGTSEAWVVGAQGNAPARPLTRGGEAYRVAWAGRDSRRLLVSGLWGTGHLALKEVDLATGRTSVAGPPDLFGHRSGSGEFAASRDGRLLAVERSIARGDVWAYNTVRGRY